MFVYLFGFNWLVENLGCCVLFCFRKETNQSDLSFCPKYGATLIRVEELIFLLGFDTRYRILNFQM